MSATATIGKPAAFELGDPINYATRDPGPALHYSRQELPYVQFAQMARLFPHKAAIVTPRGPITYAEMDAMIGAYARGLRVLGVRPGEAIASAVGNRWEMAPLFIAASRAGAVFTALNATLTRNEIAYQIGQLRPRLVIGDGGVDLDAILAADDGVAVEPEADEHAPLMVRFSSGTTGKPKAMVCSQRGQLGVYKSVAQETGVTYRDVHMVTGPLAHAALHMGISQLMVGGTVVLKEKFNKETFWSDCVEHGITNAMVVPTMIASALEYPGEAPDLRILLSMGAALVPALKQRLAERFPHLGLVEMYGSSELGMVTTLRPEDQLYKPKSVGRATMGQEVAIFDDDGNGLPAGEIGTIHVRGPMCIQRYVGDVRPTPTVREQAGEGWATSGDLGYIDDEGFLYISDRRVDLILSGGLNVYPAEVEAALSEVATVREVAVVGTPDERWGQRVTAYVVGSGDEADLVAHCREVMAPYKIPRAIFFVDELPRTPSGKVSRKLVRDRVADGGFPS